jgi:hypothetical protein
VWLFEHFGLNAEGIAAAAIGLAERQSASMRFVAAR